MDIIHNDLTLGILGPSYHYDREYIPDMNEENLGLYLEGDKYAGGGYKNSYGDNSMFFSRKFGTPVKNLNAFVGAASGYGKDVNSINGFLPMVGATYDIGNTRIMVTPEAVNFGMVFPIK